SISSFGIEGSSVLASKAVFFLVGIHAPLQHVMPEHKISDSPLAREGGDISVAAVTATIGFALTATHF
ncbi:hypothetical protein, partial [Pseudomonas mucidolens]|uniref:hypothetical protein n=1 Tax=Pseudomonas mucidolens TaxID=46679 RepID=UPI0030DAB535